MRILHVAESVKGGCGTYLNEVLRAQQRDPAITAVRVILPDVHSEHVRDLPESSLRLFASKGRTAGSLYRLWAATAEEITSFRPDCIHLHSTFAGAIGRLGLLPRRKRPPTVYCAHGWAFDMAGSPVKQRAMSLAERVLSFGCEGVIAISEHERRRAMQIGISPDRIVTVLNGIVDCAPPPPPRPAWPRRLLFIGRLDRQKGIDTLLEAISGLAGKVELRIIGSEVVGDQSCLHFDRPEVTRLGWCDESRIRQELAWSDCVLVPSRWEGFGLVAVEAMRAGRAVIASNVGGLPEVVADGRTGWLVPPEDPSALRDALLSRSDDDLVSAGAEGRQRFLDHFTIDRTAAALTAIYRQAIAMRGSISHALAYERRTVLPELSG